MNLTINSSLLLSMPVSNNITHMAIYMLLVLLADPSGAVTETRAALAERLNMPVVIIDAAVKALCQQHLVEDEGTSLRVLANKAWKLTQQKVIKKIKDKCKATETPVRADINARIEAFKDSARIEFRLWQDNHPDKEFPDVEQQAFMDYWTEHNDGGTTFRREREKVWSWQLRISTWYKNISHRTSSLSPQSSSLAELNKRISKEEKERKEQERREEWRQREQNKGGLDAYIRELQMAADGDETMRQKYPDWQYLVSKNLPSC